MGVQLETGDTGRAVTADSDGSLYSGLFGVENYVMYTGNKFKAEIQSNNKIKINDGSAIMNGRHVRIPSGDSELVTINNGSQGMNRIDLIVFRYKKELTGMESVDLVVIQGEETANVAKTPNYIQGSILTGAAQADFPLYSVELKGINIVKITPLFKVVTDMSTLNEILSDNVSNLGDSYIKFANGFLLQWGTTTHDKVKLATSSVNLQVPYRDAGYRVSLTPGRNGNLIEKLWVGDSGGNNNQRTPNHFNVSSQAEQVSYDRAIEWVTFGRWK